MIRSEIMLLSIIIICIFLCVAANHNLFEHTVYGYLKEEHVGKKISNTILKNDKYNITIYRATNGHIFAATKGNNAIDLGTEATSGIQKAISLLSPGQSLLLHRGIYEIKGTLNITHSISLSGEENETILIFKDLARRNSIWMSKGSQLKNVKLIGSINPFPYDFSQKIIANNNTLIQNITISHLGYGIETAGSSNVHINSIRCEYLQSQNDWAACIHGGKTRLGQNTYNVTINRFNVSYSNRAIELDSGTHNVYASNGYVDGVSNFHNTMHEAFTLDVHSHDGEGYSENVTYRNVYIKDSYSPTTKVSGSVPEKPSQYYREQDLPRNILYDNITVINPISRWQVNGNNITIRNSMISDSKENIFDIFMNTKNLLLDNIRCQNLLSNKFFIFTNNTNQVSSLLQPYKAIKLIYNMTILNNKISYGTHRSEPSLYITHVKGLTLVGNEIVNAPKNSTLAYLKSVSDVKYNNNNIVLYAR
jgi:hypothetical protein